MIIQVDKDGESAVQQLCDIALKQGGLQNFNQINKILNSVKLLPVLKDKKDSKSKKPDKKEPGKE